MPKGFANLNHPINIFENAGFGQLNFQFATINAVLIGNTQDPLNKITLLEVFTGNIDRNLHFSEILFFPAF